MFDIQSRPSQTKIVALIRDKDGNVKFDDYNNIPDELLSVLSQSDLDYINKIKGQN